MIIASPLTQFNALIDHTKIKRMLYPMANVNITRISKGIKKIFDNCRSLIYLDIKQYSLRGKQ